MASKNDRRYRERQEEDDAAGKKRNKFLEWLNIQQKCSLNPLRLRPRRQPAATVLAATVTQDPESSECVNYSANYFFFCFQRNFSLLF